MLQNRIRRLSLRTAIMLPFAMLMLVSVGLMGYAAHMGHERLLTEQSQRVIGGLTARTHSMLTNFLDAPYDILRVLRQEIITDELYVPGNTERIESKIRGLYETAFVDLPQISVIGFGGRDGEFAGLRREANSGFAAMVKDKRTEGELRIHAGDSLNSPMIAHFPGYDPRTRPWYQEGVRKDGSGWTPIYSNYDEKQEITISATSPSLDRNGNFQGVIVADVKLEGISRFLGDAPDLDRGVIFIIDSNDRLVAQSGTFPILASSSDTEKAGTRLMARDSRHPLVRAAAPFLSEGMESAREITQNTGERLFLKVTPFADARGLDWRIAVVMNESDLIGSLRGETMTTLWAVIGIALFGVVVGLVFLQLMIQPILRTAHAANSLARGEWRHELKPGVALRETALLIDAFNDMSARLRDSFQKLHDRIVRDPLTNLLSRSGLCETLAERGHSHPDANLAVETVVALIGLDGFRGINNSIGHDAGNALLSSIANRLTIHCPDDGLVARVEGDEFAVVLRGSATVKTMESVGQWALDLFAAPFRAGDDEVVVSACVGLAGGVLDPSDGVEAHLRHASVALSEAKRRGPRTTRVFEPDMMSKSKERTRLIAEMAPALARGEFRLVYQPVVDLSRGGRVVGAEALLRWHHPRSGLIPPDLFIPLAEESGQILAIGDWVLRTACHDIATRLHQGWPIDFDLHVNVSVRQLIQSGFVELVEAALTSSGLSADNLTLEITESALATDGLIASDALKLLRDLGVRIAIDDFGTGYSSLSYLTCLPFDGLKIDRSFVNGMTGNGQARTIVHSIVGIACSFDVHLVAEGVETLEQAAALRDLGCERAQGYLFGRPVPLDDWTDPTHLPRLAVG
jgi:diguanylate cyclase (GGDEF)-like protein